MKIVSKTVAIHPDVDRLMRHVKYEIISVCKKAWGNMERGSKCKSFRYEINDRFDKRTLVVKAMEPEDVRVVDVWLRPIGQRNRYVETETPISIEDYYNHFIEAPEGYV